MFASLLRGGRVGGWGECRVNFKRIEFAFNRLHVFPLTLKAPIMTAADDSLEYFIIVFQRKKRLDISRESSARQRIHTKHQELLPSRGFT